MPRSNILHNPATIAAPVRNFYSHGVETCPGARQLFVAGQVGVRPDGTISAKFEEQVEQMMANIKAVLASANMDFGDVVKFNAYCMKAEDIITSAEIRNRHFGSHRPATTAIVVSGLANAAWLIEADLTAARLD